MEEENVKQLCYRQIIQLYNDVKQKKKTFNTNTNIDRIKHIYMNGIVYLQFNNTTNIEIKIYVKNENEEFVMYSFTFDEYAGELQYEVTRSTNAHSIYDDDATIETKFKIDNEITNMNNLINFIINDEEAERGYEATETQRIKRLKILLHVVNDCLNIPPKTRKTKTTPRNNDVPAEGLYNQIEYIATHVNTIPMGSVDVFDSIEQNRAVAKIHTIENFNGIHYILTILFQTNEEYKTIELQFHTTEFQLTINSYAAFFTNNNNVRDVNNVIVINNKNNLLHFITKINDIHDDRSVELIIYLLNSIMNTTTLAIKTKRKSNLSTRRRRSTGGATRWRRLGKK
jgi:hypothetical protein